MQIIVAVLCLSSISHCWYKRDHHVGLFWCCLLHLYLPTLPCCCLNFTECVRFVKSSFTIHFFRVNCLCCLNPRAVMLSLKRSKLKKLLSKPTRFNSQSKYVMHTQPQRSLFLHITSSQDVGRFQKIVKLVSFLPFTGAENALENINDISEGSNTYLHAPPFLLCSPFFPLSLFARC